MLAKAKDQSGQAMIEFLLIMPVLLSFLWYMVHVNSAINKSEVGQVHARSQLFLKMFNHKAGPLKSEQDDTVRSSSYIGVAGTVIGTQATGLFAAPIETLGVGANPKKLDFANDDVGEAKVGSFRQNIRIRTVVGICTERKVLKDGSGRVTDFCGDKQNE